MIHLHIGVGTYYSDDSTNLNSDTGDMVTEHWQFNVTGTRNLKPEGAEFNSHQQLFFIIPQNVFSSR